jgi:hypothetical protein
MAAATRGAKNTFVTRGVLGSPDEVLLVAAFCFHHGHVA